MIENKMPFFLKIRFILSNIKIKPEKDYIYLLAGNKTIKTDYKKIKLGPNVFKKIFSSSVDNIIDTTNNFLINFQDYVVKTDLKMVYDINHSIETYNRHYSVQEGDVIIDIGGYHGLYSIAISKSIGPRGKIYLFEPNPDSFKVLKENLFENNIKNIIPINKAVYNKTGEFRFFKKRAGSRIVAKTFKTNTKNSIISVSAISLSEFINTNHLHKINFIKMDAEGSEIEITQDIKSIPNINNLAIATYHYRKDYASDTQEIVEGNLKDAGYKIKTKLGEHKLTYAWR